jgi:transcriptional regulator with XRE-family HTH domain
MHESLSSVIRRAILESGETRYAIAVKCGVDQAALSRFMSGKSSLHLTTIDKLVDGLGIEVGLRRKTRDK